MPGERSPHSTPEDALEWLRQIAKPDRDPNSWAQGEYPLVIQAMMQRTRDAEPILRGVVEQLEAERARVKFCPYCAGAVVDVIEGPCPGCQRAMRFEEQIQAADARITALYAAVELIQNERDSLSEQLETAQRTLAEIEEQAPPTPAEWHALHEQYQALDDAIRDALDFLTGWNGQGKIDPEIAKDILNAALEKHGAQLLSFPASSPLKSESFRAALDKAEKSLASDPASEPEV